MLANRNNVESEADLNKLLFESAKTNNSSILNVFISPNPSVSKGVIESKGYQKYLVNLLLKQSNLRKKTLKSWEKWQSIAFAFRLMSEVEAEEMVEEKFSLEKIIAKAISKSTKLSQAQFQPLYRAETAKATTDFDFFFNKDAVVENKWIKSMESDSIDFINKYVNQVASENKGKSNLVIIKIVMRNIVFSVDFKLEHEKLLNKLKRINRNFNEAVTLEASIKTKLDNLPANDKAALEKVAGKAVTDSEFIDFIILHANHPDQFIDEQGNTLLSAATFHNQKQAFQSLLFAGASLTIKNSRGDSPLRHCSRRYEPYQDNSQYFQLIKSVSNTLLCDDSDLDKYPLVKEFGQKCIRDLKNVLDAYVKEVEGRIKSYMDSYLKVSGSDIDKERAEDLVSLYHILYDGAKERNYHVVLEAFKIHIEKMKKNGSSMLFSTAFVCVTAAYQWLKDNYGAYHKQYDAFILESLRLVIHKKHRSELNEMKLVFEGQKNALDDDKSKKIISLESEIQALKAKNNTLLSEKDELVKQVGVLAGEKKTADEKLAKSEDQIKGLVKAFHQMKEKKNQLKVKVETLNVDNNKLILNLSERHASNMHTLFESSLKEVSTQLESLNKHVLNQGSKK